jgi:hypothetical protein
MIEFLESVHSISSYAAVSFKWLRRIRRMVGVYRVERSDFYMVTSCFDRAHELVLYPSIFVATVKYD